MLSREKPLVKPMALEPLFHIIESRLYLASFRSTILQSLLSNLYKQKYQKYLLYYLYQISLLRVAMKGLTTSLSCWLQGSYLFEQVRGI